MAWEGRRYLRKSHKIGANKQVRIPFGDPLPGAAAGAGGGGGGGGLAGRMAAGIAGTAGVTRLGSDLIRLWDRRDAAIVGFAGVARIPPQAEHGVLPLPMKCVPQSRQINSQVRRFDADRLDPPTLVR
jgi:hypothetical protein